MLRDLEKLINYTKQNIDLAALRLGPEHDYASLPLCVIDAVYSIGVNYTGTRNTVARWCRFQNWPMLRVDASYEHTISDFLILARKYSKEALAEQVFVNRQRTSSRSGILKSEAVLQFAEVLNSEGIERFEDVRSDDTVERVEPRIKAEVTGQSSGISFDYFMILAGSDEYIKADRMICRFVADALNETSVKAAVARELFLEAAAALRPHHPNVTPRALDHAVWNFQRSKGVET